MAMNQVARAKSLAWTLAAGGSTPTSPLSTIQDWDFGRSKDLKEFLLGTARVKTRYAGTKDATITVQTSNLAVLSGFEVGQKLTNVILTLEGAIDAGDVQADNDVTITLSSAVVTEVGNLQHSNDGSDPMVGSVTFALDRHVGASADPTCAFATSGS